MLPTFSNSPNLRTSDNRLRATECCQHSPNLTQNAVSNLFDTNLKSRLYSSTLISKSYLNRRNHWYDEEQYWLKLMTRDDQCQSMVIKRDHGYCRVMNGEWSRTWHCKFQSWCTMIVNRWLAQNLNGSAMWSESGRLWNEKICVLRTLPSPPWWLSYTCQALHGGSRQPQKLRSSANFFD